MQVLLDIIYGSDAKQKWDLYMPPPSEQGKAEGIIVFVHGGAWRSGDKAEHQVLAKTLVDATGLPVAVPNYRLSPRISTEESSENGVKHPMHAQDIAQALAAIRRFDRLSVVANVNRMFLIGHSCGAHIISSLLLRPPPGEGIPPDDPLAPEVYSSVQGVALVEGIYDLDLILKTFPGYRDFVQGAFLSETASFSQFSVNRYSLRAGSTAQWLIIHSEGDKLVDLPQAKAMFEHLASEDSDTGPDPSRVHKEFTSLTGGHDEVLSAPEFAHIVKGIIQ